MTSMPRWQITVMQKGVLQQQIVMQESHLAIGRDRKTCALVLASNHVSRVHAHLHMQGAQLSIVDADSRNGLIINSNKVKEAIIESATQVIIGDFTLNFTLLEQAFPQANTNAEAKPVLLPAQDTVPAGKLGRAALKSDAGLTPPLGVQILPPKFTTAESLSPSTAEAQLTPLPTAHILPDSSLASASLPKAPAALADAHQENDEEEEPFIPSFSLLAQLLRQDRTTSKTALSWVECLITQADELVAYALLHEQKPWFRSQRPQEHGLLDCQLTKGPTLCVRVTQECSGHRLQDSQIVDLMELGTENTRAIKTIVLTPPQSLHLKNDPYFVTLRFVPPLPPAAVLPTLPQLPQLLLPAVCMGIGLHIIIAVLLMMLPAPAPALPAPPEFNLTYKPPLLPPKPRVVVPPRPPAPKKISRATAKPKPLALPHPRRFHHHVSKSLPKAKPQPIIAKPIAKTPPKPPGILGLLQKHGNLSAPGAAAAVAAVSHLTRVDSASSSSGYRVAGLAAKLPPNEQVRTGGGGNGEIVTAGRSVLTGGAGHLQSKRNGGVEGLVQELPEDMNTSGSGSLEREAIDRVVARHQREISRCYERALTQDSSIQGKLQLEWIINEHGRVISVRQQKSTIHSTALARCIMSCIKTWRFPIPQGGSVIVSYPFLLKSIDF